MLLAWQSCGNTWWLSGLVMVNNPFRSFFYFFFLQICGYKEAVQVQIHASFYIYNA